MDRRPSRVLCLWPGLPGLWLRGQWSSLVMAGGFALLLNMAVAGTFIWPDLAGSPFLLVVWPVLAITWSVSYWTNRNNLDEIAEPQGHGEPQVKHQGTANDDTLFIQAQTEYLKGDWKLCEQLMVRQLKKQPRDLESRLLLASAYRRQGQNDSAIHQLKTMQRIDGWQIWNLEIEKELNRSRDRKETGDPEHPTGMDRPGQSTSEPAVDSLDNGSSAHPITTSSNSRLSNPQTRKAA